MSWEIKDEKQSVGRPHFLNDVTHPRSSPATSLFLNTFLTLNNVTYQAIVMFSFNFLAAAIPPSTSSVFPFGRQAKLKQPFAVTIIFG